MRSITLAIVATCGLLSASLASAVAPVEDIPISGRKIVVKDNVVAAKRKVAFVSKDQKLVAGALDPTDNGASFYLVDPSLGQQSSVFDMPASNWESKNGKYVYTDKGLVHGPVKKAKLRNGRLKIVLKGIDIDFPVLGVAPLSEVGGVFTVNAQVGVFNVCFLFPGDDGVVKKDSPAKGVYKAVNAESPDFCPSIIVP
jgi:hypothetical protein